MPLKLDVDKVLHGKSERVKCVDIHSKEPWILSALYSGNIFIWNYDTESIVRTFEVSEVPVRNAKFIERKNWFVCGTDDMNIRVYNYNTCEKVKEFEAHTDYIRCIAVHPTLPFIMSASDDMSIKLWDWDNLWENSIIFEGHTHYVMQIAINPKDSNCFATASLDRSVKVWGLNSSVPHFQLEGHERGVNCVSYYAGGERPFLVSGADDNLVKIWDYQTKTCIATLEGHSANISAVMFHPQLPIILSGSEDGSIKIWHSNTYRLETTLHYGMERVWAMAAMASSNKVAIGFDEGTIMIKLGQEEPIVSMDGSGKVVWAKNHEIQLTRILRGKPTKVTDGEPLQFSSDDLGATEFYPNYLKHNKNGQLIAVCGDGEFTIYTALKLKHKSFGEGQDFAWSTTASGSSVYATMLSGSKLKLFRNFKEFKTIRTAYSVQKIFGGYLLGARSEDDVYFYHWGDGTCIRRIEVTPNHIYWAPEGTSVAVACAESFYVLKYNEEIVEKYLSNGIDIDAAGIETAFALEQDVAETVTSGCYTGDIFIYTNDAERLKYYVGGQSITMTHLDRCLYVLGYLQKANRVYLIDKRHNIVSYELLRYVLAYQAAIVRDDLKTAAMLIERKKIEPKHHNKLAQFLEGQGHKELALTVSKDPEHQFELALALKKLDLAKEILLRSPSPSKWKQLADLALLECDFVTVEEAALAANDLALLYLLYTACNNREGLEDLVTRSVANSKFNIAFNTLYYLGETERILELLMERDAVPQAAMFARAYCPRKIDDIQAVWKQRLQSISPAAARALGDTRSHPMCFPEIREEAKEPEEDPVVVVAEEAVVPAVAPSKDPAATPSRKGAARVQTKDESEEELIREPTDYSPTKENVQSVDVDSDEVSLPSGMDDDDVLNGDDHDGAGDDDDDEFDLEDLDVDL